MASALVVLKGQAYPWHGDANYLRTVVNRQRYRQCVAQNRFLLGVRSKEDPDGADTEYNKLKWAI